jgi:hypothetical protein
MIDDFVLGERARHRCRYFLGLHRYPSGIDPSLLSSVTTSGINLYWQQL